MWKKLFCSHVNAVNMGTINSLQSCVQGCDSVMVNKFIVFIQYMIVQKIDIFYLFVVDPPPGQIAPPDRHVSINGTQQAVE